MAAGIDILSAGYQCRQTELDRWQRPQRFIAPAVIVHTARPLTSSSQYPLARPPSGAAGMAAGLSNERRGGTPKVSVSRADRQALGMGTKPTHLWLTCFIADSSGASGRSQRQSLGRFSTPGAGSQQ